MAVKWHPKKDGTGVSKCDARKQTCPNGGDAEHFATKKEALAHVEAQAAQENASAGNGSLPSATKVSNKESLSSGSLDPEKLERAREEVSQMHPGLRMDAAEDEGTSAEVLAVLADDYNWTVADSVARNPSTPVHVISSMSRSNTSSVRTNVAQNLSTPAEDLVHLSQDAVREVRGNVAKNKNTPAEALTNLSQDRDWVVRLYAAKNPNNPSDNLAVLINDDDPGVAESAQNNLSSR